MCSDPDCGLRVNREGRPAVQALGLKWYVGDRNAHVSDLIQKWKQVLKSNTVLVHYEVLDI